MPFGLTMKMSKEQRTHPLRPLPEGRSRDRSLRGKARIRERRAGYRRAADYQARVEEMSNEPDTGERGD